MKTNNSGGQNHEHEHEHEQAQGKTLVTLLTPVFNEEEGLAYYSAVVRDFLDRHQEYDFEVLLVDDGSSDSSWKIIKDLCASDSRFRGIRLSRNFGAHIALTAGMDFAKGDVLMTLAADLQDPIEVFDDFIAEWKKGARIVWGRRRTRQDVRWKVVCSYIFFKAIQRYAMPCGSQFTTGSFFLLDRKIVQCMRQFREQNRVTFAIVAWSGFDQATVLYERVERTTGASAGASPK